MITTDNPSQPDQGPPEGVLELVTTRQASEAINGALSPVELRRLARAGLFPPYVADLAPGNWSTEYVSTSSRWTGGRETGSGEETAHSGADHHQAAGG